MADKLSEEIKDLIQTLVKHADAEDRVVREAQLRRYRRLKLYWNNFSQIYWSETARDYRLYVSEDLNGSQLDQEYYDRPMNVFRPLLETVIAALAIQIPGISCVPDDADNPNDITTAKAGDKIAELLYKHNNAIWQWLQALYIHCTEGMVAAYTYEKSDKKYGTYKEKVYKDESVESFICPHCQAQVPDDVMTGQQSLPGLEDPNQNPQMDQMIQMKNDEAEEFSQDIENQFAPDDDDALLDYQVEYKGPVCPECGTYLDPELQKTKLTIPRFTKTVDKPKSRICMEVYGGLYVKIANYAKCQEDTPYLIFSYETHYSNAMEMHPDLRDEMPQGGWAKSGPNDPYEQMARLNPQYRNGFPTEQVTIKNGWIRPAWYNILNEDQVDTIRKKFPDGFKAVLVNDIVAEACNECLDDCWTLTRNPLHDYLCHDPLGELIINVQDVINDLISLTIQTIEQGIAQTWADPAVVDFNGQAQMEAAPGVLTPTKLQGGAKNISEAFFSTKNATLPPELFQFYQIVNQLGQFISAAMPSIFGGSQESGSSRTASEYAMSRTASLQRLQTPWRMFSVWWKETFNKAIPAYMKCVKEDERYVKKDDSGDYVNVFIRTAELKGKIGSVELEAAEQLPISDEQKSDMVMKLFELNNAEILQALTDPDNLPFIRKVTKMNEFVLPGEKDRIKQLDEIKDLISSQPNQLPPTPQDIQMSMQTGMPPQPNIQPSVAVDPLVDDHAIEAAVCRNWLIGEAGRLAKVENPMGYMNVMLHMKAHMAIVAQQQMQMMQQQAMMGQQQNTGAQAPNQQQQPKPPASQEIKADSNAQRTPIS